MIIDVLNLYNVYNVHPFLHINQVSINIIAYWRVDVGSFTETQQVDLATLSFYRVQFFTRLITIILKS
jgi:hypothetical protein